jgi:hypothetical protein
MILDDLLKNYDETERPDFKQGSSKVPNLKNKLILFSLILVNSR